jgi:hypothetical protein
LQRQIFRILFLFFLVVLGFVFVADRLLVRTLGVELLEEILVKRNGVFGVRLATRTGFRSERIPALGTHQRRADAGDLLLARRAEVSQDIFGVIVPGIRTGCLTQKAFAGCSGSHVFE